MASFYDQTGCKWKRRSKLDRRMEELRKKYEDKKREREYMRAVKMKIVNWDRVWELARQGYKPCQVERMTGCSRTSYYNIRKKLNAEKEAEKAPNTP
ncbi:hypothetical protein [Vibrio owensii]|uniref:hypothetical protein n=2 Tax=Vibrio owensii TaxID=696485 RepID=UPI0005F02E14|nr:hypothetical protein [Vibrio owensii]